MLLLSVVAVMGMVTEDGRMFVGGYGMAGHAEVACLGWVGIIFTVGGLIGISDNHSGWVNPLVTYSYVYAALRVVLVALDLREFGECPNLGLAGTHVSSADSTYNPALAAVALAGTCNQVEGRYLACTVVVVAGTLYGASILRTWCVFVTEYPTFGISPDESLAFARYLQKMSDQEEDDEAQKNVAQLGFSDDEQDPEEGGAVMLGDDDDDDDDDDDGGPAEESNRPQFQPSPYQEAVY